MRAPNEIDFWRGVALIMIFIDHIPGNIFENYTYQRIAISDAAEVFVFLAGWSLRLVVSGSRNKGRPLRTVMRLENRALTIYIAQIFIVSAAVAMTAAGALIAEDPLILEWNNAAAIFETPIEAQLGVVLLSHQLGYFDILPLYVLLMALAPLIVMIDQISARLLLAISLALYAVTLFFGFNIPTWPVEGRWFFNPFAWQLVFVLGFLIAAPNGVAAFAHRRRLTARMIGLPIVLLGAVLGLIRWAPDPLSQPEPRLFFMFDKTFDSPARVIHLLAAVALMGGAFALIHRWLKWLTAFASMLGRNSLNVFCAASLLSLGGQFARYYAGGSFIVDLAVVVCGIIVMGVVAWLSEWSERI